MDPKRIVALVVGASVMVLIFSALLVPIINDATTTEKTFTNDGYFKMTKYSSDSEIIIDWDYATPENIKINDDTFTFESGTSLTFAFVENAGVRIFYNLSGVQMLLPIGTMAADVADSETMHIEFTNGTVTATISKEGAADIVNTATYTSDIFCISNDGGYVMKKSDKPAYVLNDTEFIGLGVTNITGAGAKTILVKGSIEDGATATIVTTSGTAATLTDPVLTSASVAGYVDLYQLDKITFKGQVEGSADTNITYSYFVVPAEVTAELAVHPDSATNALLSAIPIIAMIGIVLAVVGVAIVGRNDY